MGFIRGIFRDIGRSIDRSIAKSAQKRAAARAEKKQKKIKENGGILVTDDILITDEMHYTVVEQKFKDAGFKSVHSFGTSGFLPFFHPSNGVVKRIIINGETPKANKYYKANARISIEYQFRR